ncbi:MAG: hypothetical protein CMP05_02255 [Xanthomarina sp.]|uniref:Uncharacterized protein n=1 Tax=Xanthomarina gelatinilytica TaxID=1137281 RepID=A0A3C0F1G6_9FLAO|nr:hypothetical protein [Xanthomarina sp.]HAB27780.1 hypothetical protein [Xanthomarina gelatinilytica]MAL22263.1 hypothetical protein [Xanthomarina sp.]MBF60801.1 hypothetical protein [Xanthomarina sp.]HAI17108.1 hypothetical protein [Xanthomarina gelatinilytica]HCY81580.1 hypothetical protein [Xanthomarina gelatinilytica]|tara:strand:- start:912 stop:1784 length:873 start_codon:yes stop_codon:yes gene_type:complete
MKLLKPIFLLAILLLISCNNDDTECCANPEPQANLIVKLKFDPNQERLNNLGQPASIPSGNAAQTPTISRMSANYIEFAPNAFTGLGEGEIIFEGAKTTEGGTEAIDFQDAIFAGNNDVFLSIPLNQIAPGDYNWVRVSLAYQEGDIDLLVNGVDYTGTLASFVGFNTYISSFNLNGSTFTVNENKLQGFWAFEALGFTSQGQAPPGATTVPNPLFDSSPIPQGSCVVTGQFENGLTLTGNETEDVVVTLSFSINNSFEWTEVNTDGKYEPEAGEQVVDMGLRGLIPMVD